MIGVDVIFLYCDVDGIFLNYYFDLSDLCNLEDLI